MIPLRPPLTGVTVTVDSQGDVYDATGETTEAEPCLQGLRTTVHANPAHRHVLRAELQAEGVALAQGKGD